MKRAAAIVIASVMTASAASASTWVQNAVRAEAIKQGVPVELAIAISEMESNHRCSAVGRMGERGPLQILPSTARSIGFHNVEAAGCAYQIRAGVRHLAICFNRSGRNPWLAAACHNQGFSVLEKAKVSRKAKRYADKVIGGI